MIAGERVDKGADVANVNDYLIWRGDLPINKRHPFNEVDALVLARVSYLPFFKVGFSRRETLGSLTAKMADFKTKDFIWPDDQPFARLLAQSRRFRNLLVTNYARHNDPKIEKQFSAVTVHLNYREMFLSFFGTDNTLNGWKEDFNMAFMETVPAQAEGLRYTRQLARRFRWKKMYLGGHSKGGNVAMYAAVMAPDSLQRRIMRVFNLDGPGLSSGLIARDVGESILPKIVSVIPQDSVIGRLLEHREKVLVVKSEAKRLYQHDLYSWQVGYKSLVRSETTKRSDLVDKTITTWLYSATPEQRKTFVDGMFEILAAAEVETPFDILEKWYTYVPAMVKSYREIPKDERKVIMEVWRKLAESYFKSRG